ncbi:MAG TPA: nuclear transport factor 2 family protein [Dehalococcoidia bacterium]|jgi:ketosteroid isomerase-like protein|nr:nuclear transport factor 2 family protein [Dehalococcoidia bacterium]
MTEEVNTRVVQDVYTAFRQGNVAAVLDAFSDVIEWHLPGSPEAIPWARTRRTRHEVAEFLEEFSKLLDVLAVHTNAFISQGDKVVVLGSVTVRTKATGHEYTDHFAMVWTLKNGKIVGHRTYHDTARTGEAFRDLFRN